MEIERKRKAVSQSLRAASLDRVIFRGLDWVSWALAGGEGRVLLSAETGVADVVIEADGSMRVRTDEIEAPRLYAEEVPSGIDVEVRPWIEAAPCLDGKVASDRPSNGEAALPKDILIRKWILEPEEQERLRRVGRLATLAMEETLARARPEWSEFELAAEGARACMARGLDPCLVMAAGARRLEIYRHPLPKGDLLGRKAMLVFCARRWGLFANVTRLRFFDAPLTGEIRGLEILSNLEDLALRLSVEGRSLGEIYEALAAEYERNGLAGEIRKHHQGGTTGYLARETIARPGVRIKIEPGMAVAWNPSLPGLKKEDTILIHRDRFERVTAAVSTRKGESHVESSHDI